MSNIPNGRTDTDACVPCTCYSRIIDSSIPRSHHRQIESRLLHFRQVKLIFPSSCSSSNSSSSSSSDGGGNLHPIGLVDVQTSAWLKKAYALYQTLQTNRLAPLSPKLHTWYDDTGSRRTTPAHLEENLIVSLPKAYLALAVPCLRSIFAAWTGVFQIFTQLDQLYNERTPNLELDSQGRSTIGFLKSRQKLANGQRRAGRCSLVGANCSPARAAPRVIEPKKTSRPELSLPQLHGSMPGRCLHNLTTIDATIFDEHLKCSNYPRPLSIYYSLCMPRTVQAAARNYNHQYELTIRQVALQSPSKHARVRANGVAAAWKPVASVDRQR
ncbi:hypothetical protein T07_6934 [Trichinella nelsoni]|uniref:Uncharacterized protein n=1 Tax=Trichinella nelsoni TaxID=6336 RepID=A0A0V0S120_9BILA|nr:hypothetical protein T07_6934 [Trichinella nelsoni]